jgi:hypothetical protein
VQKSDFLSMSLELDSHPPSSSSPCFRSSFFSYARSRIQALSTQTILLLLLLMLLLLLLLLLLVLRLLLLLVARSLQHLPFLSLPLKQYDSIYGVLLPRPSHQPVPPAPGSPAQTW